MEVDLAVGGCGYVAVFGWVCFGLVVLQWLWWWWFFGCLVAAGLILPCYWVVYVFGYVLS